MSKADHRGRTAGHSARRLKPGRVPGIQGQFVALRRDLLESDAWAGMTLAARLALDRLAIEHMAHGGSENGNLIVTYDDFAAFGVRRASVAEAIRLLEKLGLIVVTERGRGGNAEFRRPARYRISFLPTRRAEPGDEWKHYRAPGHHTRNIDSRLENAPEPVGAKTRPGNRSVRRENEPEIGRENEPGVLNCRRAADG